LCDQPLPFGAESAVPTLLRRCHGTDFAA
jgi:hypothetical protein